MDTWVCPNDRQLALRAKLGTGWSVHTPKCSIPSQDHQPLTEEETNRILLVIKRAEKLEQMEMTRVGNLVERLEKLKIQSQGDGHLRCGLCGDRFRLLGASPNLCHDCSKNVCNKCGIETSNSRKKLIYLCKLCSEKRELWRKSGAWFYKGIPQHLKPSSHFKRIKDDNNNNFHNLYKNKNNNNNKKFISTQNTSSNEKATKRSDSRTHDTTTTTTTSTTSSNFKNRERKFSCYTTNPAVTSGNINDFYYDHYKYRPSFLISTASTTSRDVDDGGNDEEDIAKKPGLLLHESDNELDIVNRLQNNRKAMQENKDNDNTANTNTNTLVNNNENNNNKNNNNGNNNNNKYNNTNNNNGCRKKSVTNCASDSPPKNYLSWLGRNNSKDHVNERESMFGQYARNSKRFSSDDEEEDNNVAYGNDDSLNIVCKKVRPKESESDTSSYDINHSTNQSLNRSSDLSTNRSFTHSSDQSTSSASINQLINHPNNLSDASINQLKAPSHNSTSHHHHIYKAKNKSADLLPLQIPSNFVYEEEGSSVPETPASLGVLEFSIQYVLKENLLRCFVHRAKNLPAMDKRGLCDAYVRTHLLPGNCKATKRRTKTVDGSRNPEWNEVLEYQGVFVEDLKKKDMRLSILDEDTISDKFIGETIVNLRNLTPDVCKEYSVYLSGLQVLGAGGERKGEVEEAGRILLGVMYEEEAAKLVVTVHRCVNLLAMDSNGFSDPYVKIYLKPPRDRKTKRKTRVKTKTLNPEFNEVFSYRLKDGELSSKSLDVSVWDKDIGSNDFIGKVVLNKDSTGSEGKHWMEMLKKPSHVHTQWHVLKKH